MSHLFLQQLLQPDRATEVVDIGANPIDGVPPYAAMFDAGLCRITGFEPQEEALAELLAKIRPNERYLPYAVGDGKQHVLNVCHGSGMTSLFKPDASTLCLFELLRPYGQVTRRVSIATQRLDDIAEITCLDFLKIDIQGGELAVFQNGRTRLSSTVMVQTEVSFVTLYENQPTLGDIDTELRSQGFMPHCFAAIKRWPISPFVLRSNPRQAINQLLEADMVYMRDISKPDLIDGEQLKHMALLAHHCYQSFDLALRCIALLEGRQLVPIGSQLAYINFLTKT